MYDVMAEIDKYLDGDIAHMNDIVAISNKVVEIERRMAEYKALEEEQKSVKQALFDAMSKHGVKSWVTPNGIKITRVDAIESTTTTVAVFDESAFAAENPALYGMYQKDVVKTSAGRSGYVKVTVPKES